MSCTRCNKKPANHTLTRWWKKPETEHLCCECHIKSGGSPADWHLDCMRIHRRAG